MEKDHSGASSRETVVQVCFPVAQASLLDGLNRQREEGRFCDLSIHVQGQVFKAHRCVLAASSPYFHDQVILKNMSTVSIPAVMDPLAFQNILRCAYTGQLCMLRNDIVNYLTVGSVLQMWHIVDKCTELLHEGKGIGDSGSGVGGSSSTAPMHGSQENPESGGTANENASGSNSVVLFHCRSADHKPNRQPSLSESQSPSSTNYFSPREVNYAGGSTLTTSLSGEGQTLTPSYSAPFEEGDAEEDDDVLDEEEDALCSSGKPGCGSHRRTKSLLSGCDQGVGISDSFGVSSYQGGDTSPWQQKKPTFSQRSIMPHKQLLTVKTEPNQDDELIVCGGANKDRRIEEDKESQTPRKGEPEKELNSRAEAEMGTLVDYCQSSEDYLKHESRLLDHPPQQNPIDSRASSTLLIPLDGAMSRAQLFPLDMQGNQILLYSQATLDSCCPMGVGSGLSGTGLGGPGREDGAVHLSGQGGELGGPDGGTPGGSGKVYLCQCGKTFVHKSMRDRHMNMHLGLRPFNCPICTKKFKMKHHMTEHMKTHTGLKPFMCHSCGKTFMWRDSCMRHRVHCEERGDDGGRGGSIQAGSSQDTQGLSQL